MASPSTSTVIPTSTASPAAVAAANAAAAAAAKALKEVLDKIFAPAILGVICDAWWVGIICVLTYRYYMNFPRDRLITKLLVAWILFLQLFCLCILSSMVYYYFVTSYGQPIHMAESIWEWSLYIGLLAVVAFSVQLFYAHRLYTLSGGSFILGGLVIALAVTSLGFGLASMGTIFKVRSFAILPDHTWLVVIWLSLSTACDIFISSTQVFFLLRRRRNGLARTNRMINTLILYVVASGLLTSLVLILQLATFVAMGFNYLDFFLAYQTTAIRSLSLLANLSARRRLRKMDHTTEFVLPLSETGAGGHVGTPIVFGREKINKIDPVPVTISNPTGSGNSTDIESFSNDPNIEKNESTHSTSFNHHQHHDRDVGTHKNAVF